MNEQTKLSITQLDTTVTMLFSHEECVAVLRMMGCLLMAIGFHPNSVYEAFIELGDEYKEDEE